MKTSHILYIEDEPRNRLLVQKILESYTYPIQVAIDGLSGLMMIRQHQPALVLLDINLPKLTGWEVLDQVKDNPKLHHIPIVALTAAAMEGDRERLLAAGCDDYLAKPFRVDELVAIVKQYYPVKKQISML
ncbi:MAG: response regulator [Chloroflexota bacterium]